MQFKVLGPLELWIKQTRIGLGGRKPQHILAVLLLAGGRMVSVQRMIEAAWDGEAPPTAPHQVRKIIADLRRRLGAEVILTDGHGYRLAIGDDQLDLTLFDLRMARAAEAIASGLTSNAAVQLDLGLRLWRDSALHGLGGSVLGPAIVRLEERRLAASEQLFDLRMMAGEAASVIDELRDLVDRHPLRETLRQRLMLALRLVGRQSEALQVFADTRETLAEELGVEPGAALQRLHEQILRGDPVLDVQSPPQADEQQALHAAAENTDPSPNTLPYNLPDFTGRTDELDNLIAIGSAARDNAMSIVAIDGMAGVGKSSLALQVAHTIADKFPDGQLFVDLRGHVKDIEPLHPMDALAQLLRAIGIGGEQIPDDLATRSTMWRAHTAGKRLIILLDDAADADQVRPLLPGSASCLVLVTSRARINRLDGATFLSLPPMSYAESANLVNRIAGANAVDPGTAGGLDELVELCGHLPLALRIAATRLRNRPMWTVADLVDRLRAADQRLEELTVGDRSVTAVIEVSYRRLPGEHQRLLQCVAVTMGKDFDAHIAGAIAGSSLVRTKRLLEDLLDAQLLSQPRAERYSLHGLLRQYALDVASIENPPSAGVAARFRNLLDYYLHTAEAAASQIHPGRRRLSPDVPTPAAGRPALDSQEAALGWFDQELDGLMNAVSHVAEHGPDLHGSYLPRAIASYLQIRGQLQNHVAMLERALVSAARNGERAIEVMNLSTLSSAYWQLGQPENAFVNMWRALEISERAGDRESEGECLNRIALLFDAVGRYEQAQSFLNRALWIHREHGNLFEEGLALNGISTVNLVLGQYEAAREAATTALRLHRRLHHGIYVVSATNCIATAQLRLGDHAAALENLATALAATRMIGYQSGEAAVLVRYADAHATMGDLDEAHNFGVRALEMIWALQVPAIEAEITNILAGVHRARGELSVAMAQHRNALEIAKRSRYRIEVARALEGIGLVLADLGDLAAAIRYSRSALRHHLAMGTPDAERLSRRIDDAASRKGA